MIHEKIKLMEKKNKMKQSILYINFKDHVDDETMDNIITKFYNENEKSINSMEAQNLKSSVDIEEVKENSNKFIFLKIFK